MQGVLAFPHVKIVNGPNRPDYIIDEYINGFLIHSSKGTHWVDYASFHVKRGNQEGALCLRSIKQVLDQHPQSGVIRLIQRYVANNKRLQSRHYSIGRTPNY